jgi:hypothetical protein
LPVDRSRARRGHCDCIKRLYAVLTSAAAAAAAAQRRRRRLKRLKRLKRLQREGVLRGRLWSKAVRSGPRCDLLSGMSRHQWGLCRAREGDAPFTTPISAAAAPSEHLSATSVPGTLGTELEASSEEMIVERPRRAGRPKLLTVRLCSTPAISYFISYRSQSRANTTHDAALAGSRVTNSVKRRKGMRGTRHGRIEWLPAYE